MTRPPNPEGVDSGAAARAAAQAFRVTLPPLRSGEPPFEGPLDLLLHLVREHRVDLFDIPIARITESYLAALRALQQLDIDLAGDFLHMAAQLVLMKSKLLLPRTEVAEDADSPEPGQDPRAELVRRLLEYQKYRAAARELGRRQLLDRDVFTRRARAEAPPAEGPEGIAEVSAYQLIEALDRALRNLQPPEAHQVAADRLSITDAIGRVAEALRARRRVGFAALLAGPGQRHGRAGVIATFLAILEMARLGLLRILQRRGEDGTPAADIAVEATDTLGEGTSPPEVRR